MSPRVYLVAKHNGAEVTILDSIAFVIAASPDVLLRVEHDGAITDVAKGELSQFEVYVEPPEGPSEGARAVVDLVLEEPEDAAQIVRVRDRVATFDARGAS